jgi:hypothetical protein
MDTNQRGKIAGGLSGLAAGLSPMNSFTFLLALAVTAVGAWSWLKQSGDPRPPFPFYGIIAASYAGGFLIGRVFWKVLKTAAIVAAIVLGGLFLLGRAHVDTSKARKEVQAGSAWVQDEASRTKKYLLHYLPSGGAAGVGVFAGGRRRRGDRGDTPK